MAQVHAELVLEEDSVVYTSNGLTTMLGSYFTNNVHDFSFIVLVKVSKDLGLAGSATGRL
jgi:hypothetical protein